MVAAHRDCPEPPAPKRQRNSSRRQEERYALRLTADDIGCLAALVHIRRDEIAARRRAFGDDLPEAEATNLDVLDRQLQAVQDAIDGAIKGLVHTIAGRAAGGGRGVSAPRTARKDLA